MNIKDIKNPSSIKKMSKKDLKVLAADIRSFLIENISKTGGHLSSNLGVVELTIAMHYVFDSPKDKLLFDVGHQCYTHKILTGRADEFETLRQIDGMSGFIKRSESEHDVWESGHSSTSLSAQCGMLLSQSFDNTEKVVSLIGDSSIANGVSFEALNYMGTIKHLNPIIILNDNNMSISPSVGAFSRMFSRLRSSDSYQKINSSIAKITPRFIRKVCHRIKTSIKGFILAENYFEDMGYDYMGPFDGNDIEVCIKMLNAAKQLNKPCVVHFVTKKGKGYKYSEEDIKGDYHGVGKFNVENGLSNDNHSSEISFSLAMSKCFEQLLLKETHYIITPAMLRGSELHTIKKYYPQNIIDVGIAEEHATVMAASMAQRGQKVFLMLYSTFAQRAYDYILNDIARTDTHVVIGLDRAGIVPFDGETHQGIYDISMFNAMPNIQIVMPKDGNELNALVKYADKITHPIVIRYEKRNTELDLNAVEEITKPTWTVEQDGNDMIVITYGNGLNVVKKALNSINKSIKVVNARFIKPMDEEMLLDLLKENKPILVYENVVTKGGLVSNIEEFARNNKIQMNLTAMGLSSEDIITHGDFEALLNKYHLSSDDVADKIKDILED